MKRRSVFIIVSLMSLAVAGLIIIQIYWIATVMAVEEERFNKNVHEALSLVIDKIEKTEAANVVLKRFIDSDGDKFSFYQGNDKDENLILLDTAKNKIQRNIYWLADSNSNVDVKIISDENHSQVAVEAHSTGTISKSIKTHNTIWINEKVESLYVKRTEVVEEVLDELVNITRTKPFEKRVDGQLLDSLLSAEFLNQGINIEFNFWVESGDENKVISSKGVDTTKLPEPEYRAELFPRDIFKEPNLISVNFPGREGYILKEVSLIMGIAIGLIFLISALFFKTLKMFITQQKLTSMRDALINNVSHEFNTPITTISLACDIMEQNGAGLIAKYRDVIREENSRLKKMVENLLDSAFRDEKEIMPEREEFDLIEMAGEIKHLFDEEVPELKLVTECEKEKLLVNWDKKHIFRVLTALIDNAVKYGGAGGKIILSIKLKK